MRVIKNGTMKHYARCEKCNSILEYTQVDINNMYGLKRINCSVCNNIIDVNDNDEPAHDNNKLIEKELQDVAQ